MRVAFLAAIFCVAALYTYSAFELNFLTSTGRLGPAFLPRIVGVLLVVMCLYGLVMEVRGRRRQAEAVEPGDWRDLGIVVGLTAAFVALLNVLGGVIAMAAFLFAALSVFNRGRLMQNLSLTVLLPLGVYLLFDVWLNASMPQGILLPSD